MRTKKDFEEVVIIADMIGEETIGDDAHLHRNLEQTDTETLAELLDAIEALDIRSHVYHSPGELARHADRHAKDVVLTIFGGRDSRNRMALVPAVCESFGIRCIGPDTFGRIVAQDKGMSKRLALDCGLSTPDWRIVRSESDFANASGIDAPVVLKPLVEGSSIGIAQGNLVRDSGAVEEFGRDLLKRFGPIIIERFVPGREVAFTNIEGTDARFSEIVMEGDEDYFEYRLFDAREKTLRDPRRGVRNIDELLLEEDRVAIEAFLKGFGEYGYCRVDGRLKDGKFHFIELTPDAWLGRRGQFAMSFLNAGWTYPDVIEAILTSGSPAPRGR